MPRPWRAPRAFVAENAEAVLRFVNRAEKRQALNVVPMRVRQQHGEMQRLVFEFVHQLTAKQAEAGASVQNDEFAFGPDFHTGSIAAVFDGARSRSRCGAAHAPQLSAIDAAPEIRVGISTGFFGSGGNIVDVESLECGDEFAGFNGFREIIIRSGLERRAAVRLEIPSGGDHDGGLSQGGIRAQFTANLEAIDAGH